MMKCEHCGKKDASFYYKSNINGKVTQLHLCADCAEALGYTDTLRKTMRPMRLFDDDFFTRPFGMLEDMMGRFGSRMLTEYPAPAETGAEEDASRQQLLSEEERRQLQGQRQRNALEHQLQTAIREERYEDASRLRDEIRGLAQ